MAFIRRSRRVEVLISCSIFILLIVNLIYFKRIEFKLDTANYLSKVSIGTSDRDEINEVIWPMHPTLYNKKIDEKNKPVFGPETLEESIKHEQANEIKKYQINQPNLLINDMDYDDLDEDSDEVFDKSTTEITPSTLEAPILKPHPLKPPKTYELNDFIPENQEPPKKTIVTHWDICPETPPNLNGEIRIDTNEELLDNVQEHVKGLQVNGGFHMPVHCVARNRVAIIVPYRNREKELAMFLNNIHPFLMNQQLDYGIFIVEQTVGTKFNRAMLLNVGYLEAKKIKEFDCFIFHDVDLLPLNDRISYTCSKNNPRHLAVAVDKFKDKLPSNDALNGVIAVTSEQFEKLNGYSNSFWGWGGEDLDFANRVKSAGYKIERPDANVAKYTMLNKYDPEEPNKRRFDLLNDGAKNFKTNGLNSVKYMVQCNDKSPAFTWILTTLKEEVPGEGSSVEFLGVK